MSNKITEQKEEIKHHITVKKIYRKMFKPMHIGELDMATMEYKELEKEFQAKTRYEMQEQIKELEVRDSE